MSEQAAIRRDAEKRLIELRRTARRLWDFGSEDAEVLSELVAVVGQIRACEEVLRSGGDQ